MAEIYHVDYLTRFTGPLLSVELLDMINHRKYLGGSLERLRRVANNFTNRDATGRHEVGRQAGRQTDPKQPRANDGSMQNSQAVRL